MRTRKGGKTNSPTITDDTVFVDGDGIEYDHLILTAPSWFFLDNRFRLTP